MFLVADYCNPRKLVIDFSYFPVGFADGLSWRAQEEVTAQSRGPWATEINHCCVGSLDACLSQQVPAACAENVLHPRPHRLMPLCIWLGETGNLVTPWLLPLLRFLGSPVCQLNPIALLEMVPCRVFAEALYQDCKKPLVGKSFNSGSLLPFFQTRD